MSSSLVADCIREQIAKAEPRLNNSQKNPIGQPGKLQNESSIRDLILTVLNEELGYATNGQNQAEEARRNWFQGLIGTSFADRKFLELTLDQLKRYREDLENQGARRAVRTYYAVGLIFAGDTPGSPFGEFAVASDIQRLSDELRFSMRPVFEPRSSFRELRVRPGTKIVRSQDNRGQSGLTPGEGRADERPGGPQPEVEPLKSGPGSG